MIILIWCISSVQLGTKLTDSHNVKPDIMKSDDGNMLDRHGEETRKCKCLISELMYRTQIICHKYA